jgi:hypothetical protein
VRHRRRRHLQLLALGVVKAERACGTQLFVGAF